MGTFTRWAMRRTPISFFVSMPKLETKSGNILIPVRLIRNITKVEPASRRPLMANRVFTLSRKGDIFCLDAKTGKIVWSKNLAKELGAEIPTWGFAGSPFVEKNLLLLNVGSHGTALDKTTGKVIWTSDKTPSGYSTAVLLISAENVARFSLGPNQFSRSRSRTAKKFGNTNGKPITT